ncbi:serine/threonine protein kinase, partial [Streptomyces zhihengii]
PGQRRPGSARNKAAAVRKRRITLGAAAVAVAAVLGVGGWLVAGGDDGDSRPHDQRQSAPSEP